MNTFTTPSSERLHIAIFGRRNAGKSSLINAITNQEISIVSQKPGTTTDPVSKAMEIQPLGPVVIIDTPGYDDNGYLGKLRVEKTKSILDKTDIAVLVIDINDGLTETDTEYIEIFKQKNIPYAVVYNKCDNDEKSDITPKENVFYISAKNKFNIDSLINYLQSLSAAYEKKNILLADIVKKNDTVILVTPIDSGAPQGRIILPQQQTIRSILDAEAIAIVTQVNQLKNVLSTMSQNPALVITDSQVFAEVNKIVPSQIPLTSFSILMARYKGFLKSAAEGAYVIDSLSDGDKVLICEGCTHHKKCDDIGSIKIPKWLREYTQKNLEIHNTSGSEFPQNIADYKLIIHCGGCMLTERQMQSRKNAASSHNIPITNYGIAIAHMNKILQRSIEIFTL